MSNTITFPLLVNSWEYCFNFAIGCSLQYVKLGSHTSSLSWGLHLYMFQSATIMKFPAIYTGYCISVVRFVLFPQNRFFHPPDMGYSFVQMQI